MKDCITRVACAKVNGSLGHGACVLSCRSDFSSVSLQGLRNLRYKQGETEFGGKNIVKCKVCSNGCSNERLILGNLAALKCLRSDTDGRVKRTGG